MTQGAVIVTQIKISTAAIHPGVTDIRCLKGTTFRNDFTIRGPRTG